MSRPMYETIHTGMPSNEHGIVANSVVRLSNQQNVFRSLKDAGKVTAAAAYYWYSELYNRAPYDRIDDKETDDPSLNIQHGRFYTEDVYPDVELFASAAHLVRKFSPDYLLLHPMPSRMTALNSLTTGTRWTRCGPTSKRSGRRANCRGASRARRAA
jgi:predicted AlkP superfamily pyrophosphatase or phosphodiesterase